MSKFTREEALRIITKGNQHISWGKVLAWITCGAERCGATKEEGIKAANTLVHVQVALEEDEKIDGLTPRQLAEQRAELLEALNESNALNKWFADIYGAEHTDDCPEDDTCECEEPKRINRVIAANDAAIARATTAATGEGGEGEKP